MHRKRSNNLSINSLLLLIASFYQFRWRSSRCTFLSFSSFAHLSKLHSVVNTQLLQPLLSSKKNLVFCLNFHLLILVFCYVNNNSIFNCVWKMKRWFLWALDFFFNKYLHKILYIVHTCNFVCLSIDSQIYWYFH